jgi:type I restriction enzyme S subunit
MTKIIKPHEWELLPLDEVFDIARGGSPRPIKKYLTDDENGINWIKIGDTKHVTKYIYKTKQKIIKEGLTKSQVVIENDFILSNSMSFGRPYIMRTSGCIHDGWLLLRKKLDNTSVDFMYYLLSSDVIKNQFKNKAAGSTVQNLNIKLVSSVQALIPTYPEQQKIADILSTVDEKIEIIDQQIIETERLKKGLMQRLLTKGIGHVEFNDSHLGKIPKSWEVSTLVKHIKLFSGFAFKSDGFNEEGKGHKVLRGINITEGALRWNDKIDKWWDLPFEDVHRYSACLGDLVISMDGSKVGRNYARVKECDLPLLIVQRVACLRAKESLDLDYLHHIIGSPLFTNYVDAVKTSSGIPHISSKNIKDFHIPFPPVNEQKKIAEILNSIDDKTICLNNKRIEYTRLKSGLMQQLLTGKIKVSNLVEV